MLSELPYFGSRTRQLDRRLTLEDVAEDVLLDLLIEEVRHLDVSAYLPSANL